MREPTEACAIDAEGNYRLDGIEEGPATVFLCLAASELPTGFNSSRSLPESHTELGRVEVHAGRVTRADFDLAELAPGALEVTVLVSGTSAAGCVVTASSTGRGGMRAALCDERGRARLAPLLPGAWKLRVGPLEGRWSYEAAAPVVLAPAGESAVELQISVAAGRIQIVEAGSGEALASRELRVGQQRAMTDGEGWLELELTPGSYPLRMAGDRLFGHVGDLEWGPGGPLQERVEVGPAD